MATDWTHVRLQRSTLEWLERTRASMMLGAEMGLRELTVDNRDRVSIDQIIRELLYARERHHERARMQRARAKLKRAARRLAAELEAATPTIAGEQQLRYSESDRV